MKNSPRRIHFLDSNFDFTTNETFPSHFHGSQQGVKETTGSTRRTRDRTMDELDPQRQLHVIADDGEKKDTIIREQHCHHCVVPCSCCRVSSPVTLCRTTASYDPFPSIEDSLSSSTNGGAQYAHDEITAFREAARITRTIGAAVIKRHAVEINRRLLHTLKQGMESDNAEEESHRTKRRKLSTLSPSSQSNAKSTTDGQSGAAAAASVSSQEEESIWNQVDRMRRMSMFLKNAQLAQSFFLQEMTESFNDDNFRSGAKSL